MWLTLLVMAIVVSLEPFRIGMTVLMLNRPRPVRQLAAFLAGGFAMGTTVGVVVLFVLRPAVQSVHVTLPRMQIAVGLVLLAVAAAVVVGVRSATRRQPADRAPGRVARHAKRLFDGRSLWTAGAVGLGIALPSVDYLAALAIIAASGAAVSAQFGALLVFNVVAFALVEIPLVCYLVAPRPTREALSALNDWVRTRGRYGVCALMAAVGGALLGVGVAGL